MPSTLSAHEKTVGTIFSDEFQFTIPDYQRPYAWGKKEAGELVDDLLDALSDGAGDVSELPPYFLGSIVLKKAEAAAPADVIDGQQRLTTLTILLAALRAHLPAELAANITPRLYQQGDALQGKPDQFRLKVREQAFFEKNVQKAGGFEQLVISTNPLPDKQDPFRVNACLFDERLRNLPSADRVRLASFILLRCFLVVVATPDLDSAYRIFSVMNSRGLDLTASDILKAQLTGNIGEQEREIFTAIWEQAESDLGRESFVDLFGHIRMIYRKAKPKATLLQEFKEHVITGRDPRSVIAEIIAPYAGDYGQLLAGAYSSTSDAGAVNEQLRWLGRIEWSDWVPPALSFLRRYGSDATATAQFFAGLERLSFSMLVRRIGVNDRIERFSKLTAAIEEEDWATSEGPLALSQVERTATRATLDGPVYETLSARSRTTLLLRLDALLSDGSATYDHPVITVEHVLPQTPPQGSEWLSWFSDPKDRERWTHRLGNLALLTRKKNSSASNYPFTSKKTAYFMKEGATPFPLTNQTIAHERWTPAIVAKRHAALLARLTSHWSL